MKNLLIRLLAVVGGLVIVFGVLMIIVLMLVAGGKKSVPSKAVLELDLEGGVLEYVPDDPIGNIVTKSKPRTRDIVEALDKAGNDGRVSGLIARIGAGQMGWAQAQEIRDAVKRFRDKKKFAIAFSETFGEVSAGNGGYYLATAFDEIWLQPSGDVNLTGVRMESLFLKNTFTKLDIRVRGDHRYEYKNAFNMFVEDKYTGPHREAMQAIANSWYRQLSRGISEGRGIAEPEVQKLIDGGPYIGQQAVDAKLVNGLAYRDEVYDKVKKRAGEDSKLLFAGKYLERAGRPHESGDTIALIHGVGGVTRGKSEYDPLGGSVTMGSDSVAAALRAAIEDKSVKAIIFRVDSPGGSYVASDTIWRETVRARQKGKPVIVTMGNLAGSGGYFVAMAADKIVAQPGTITGSIGVLGLKLLTRGGWNKLGVTWDAVQNGNHAAIYSSLQDYSPEEWAKFQSWLDRVYADFTGKVADGRKLPKERVLEIAKGRIWSGEDAKAIGLVDELGGYETAIRLAKEAAKIPADKEINLREFPRKRTTFESLMADEPENSDQRYVEALVRSVQMLAPIVEKIKMLDPAARGSLAMPVDAEQTK
jgi:protease-4